MSIRPVLAVLLLLSLSTAAVAAEGASVRYTGAWDGAAGPGGCGTGNATVGAQGREMRFVHQNGSSCQAASIRLDVPDGIDRIRVHANHTLSVAGGDVLLSLHAAGQVFAWPAGPERRIAADAVVDVADDVLVLEWRLQAWDAEDAAATVQDVRFVALGRMPQAFAMQRDPSTLLDGAFVDRTLYSVDVNAVQVGTLRPELVLDVPAGQAPLGLLAPDGTDILDDVETNQNGDRLAIVIPADVLQQHGPGTYRLDARAPHPVIAESGQLVIFTFLLAGLTGAAALSGHGVTNHVAAHRGRPSAYALAGIYVFLMLATLLLFVQMFFANDARLMVRTPLHPVAGGQYAALTAVAAAFAALATWLGRRRMRALLASLRRGDQEARRMADAQEEIGAFTAAAAHDLRSPARSIQANARTLARSLPGMSQASRDMLESIASSARRMDELIQALMSYTALAGQELRWDETSTYNLGLAVHTDLHGLIQERGADLAFEGDGEVHGDRAMVRQAVQNLVENAIKFSPDPWIRVRTSEVDGGTEVRVADRGPGIPHEERERITQAFERGRTGASVDGHGLGLAIVQRIMAKHGGRFTIASQVDRGTVMSLWFPHLPPVDDEPEGAIDEVLSPTDRPMGLGVRHARPHG